MIFEDPTTDFIQRTASTILKHPQVCGCECVCLGNCKVDQTALILHKKNKEENRQRRKKKQKGGNFMAFLSIN